MYNENYLKLKATMWSIPWSHEHGGPKENTKAKTQPCDLPSVQRPPFFFFAFSFLFESCSGLTSLIFLPMPNVFYLNKYDINTASS